MLALLIAVTLMGAPERTPASELQWEAPAECPDATQGFSLVEQYLGDRTHPEIGGSVRIDRDGDRWRARIEPIGADPRILHAEQCESLARAAALVIALSLAPSDTVPEPEPQEDEPPREDERSLPPPEVVDAPAERIAVEPRGDASPLPPRRRPIAITHGLGVAAGPSYGPTPMLAATIRAGYRVGGNAWRIEIDALYATPRRIDYDDEALGGRFQSFSGAVLGCGLPHTASVVFPLCAGIEAGGMFGRGVGFSPAVLRAALWVGGLASAGVFVRLAPRLALRLGGDLLVVFSRPAFRLTDREELFRAARVGGRGTIGVEIALR